MKKLFLCLMLILSLAAVPAFAQESAAYVPGSVASALLADAFAGGRMVCAQVDMDFDADVSKMGFATEEEAALADAIFEMMNNAVLAVSAGQTPDGLVLDLAAQYAAGEAEPVYADARLGMSRSGLFAETSLLPEERLAISWEALLALCDVDAQISQPILSLLAMEPAELELLVSNTLAQLAEQSQTLLPLVSQYAAPYGETILSHVQSWPRQINENVAGDDYYPAAAKELVMEISAKNVGGLIIALAEQLEQDAILSSVLNLALSQAAETAGMTVASLCAEVREFAAETLTDESNPLCIYIGLDEAENLVYVCLNVYLAGGVPAVLNVFITPDETGMHTQLYVDAYALDEQKIPSGAALSVDYIADANPQVHDLSAGLYLYTGDTALVTLEFAAIREETVTDEGMNGYADSIGFYMGTAGDGENTEITVYENSESAPNADGGEYRYTVSSVDIQLGETLQHTDSSQTFLIVPTEDGPAGVYTELVQSPDMGFASSAVTWDLYTKAYEPLSAPTVTDLGAADDAALEALALRLLTNVQAPMNTLFAQLPHEILMLIGAPAADSVEAAAEPAPQPAPRQPSAIDGLELIPITGDSNQV